LLIVQKILAVSGGEKILGGYTETGGGKITPEKNFHGWEKITSKGDVLEAKG